MRPIKLEMKGFSAFRNQTEIDFTDVDLLALVGATGSGKSTIIDGITFGLYGSVARYEDNRAVAPVINQMSNEARVCLTFEVDHREYTATRVVRRTAKGASTKEARLECGSEVLAGDAKSVSTEVARLIGLDSDQFNRTVVLPQGRFADFLHADPRERQATLRQLLGLDIYERIGKAARARAAERRTQADLLRQEIDAAVDLTDERRAELEARQRTLGDTRKEFAQQREDLRALQHERLKLEADRQENAAALKLVGGITKPDGIDALASEIQLAAEQLRTAKDEVDAATKRRLAASAAVEAGPEAAEFQAVLDRHGRLAEELERLEQLESELPQLASECEAAEVAATEVRNTHTRLNEESGSLLAASQAAADDVTHHPTLAEIDLRLSTHEGHQQHVDELASVAAALQDVEQELPNAERAAQETNDVAGVEAAKLVEVERRAGIVAFVESLAVGEPCPLCLQDLHELPTHPQDDDLELLRRKCEEARNEDRTAQAELRRVQQKQDAARVGRDAAQRAVDRSAAAIESIPSKPELVEQRERVLELAEKARLARGGYDEANTKARAYATDAKNVKALETESELKRKHADLLVMVTSRINTISELLKGLVDAPAEAECRQMIETATKLATLRSEVEAAERDARTQLDHCQSLSDEMGSKLASERSALNLVRDDVAHLRPPATGGVSLQADWTNLLAWSADKCASLTSDAGALDGQIEAFKKSEGSQTDSLTARVSEVCEVPVANRSLEELSRLLDDGLVHASTELRTFDVDRARLADVQQRVDQLSEEGSVAAKLGHLLRSDGFERWLMQAALDGLASRATDRLLELSSSQYSLVLDDRSFAVCDHANADEVRSARTLSGGETFLASLALALALAESTADLSANGSPAVGSIFLDEGFGTLDPETLDVVASAIEELGATGRMVGIVTHIRDLADRMPVRFEVTKLAGSSSVERVEV